MAQGAARRLGWREKGRCSTGELHECFGRSLEGSSELLHLGLRTFRHPSANHEAVPEGVSVLQTASSPTARVKPRLQQLHLQQVGCVQSEADDWARLDLFLDSHQWRQAQLFSLYRLKGNRTNNGSEPEKQRLKGGGESDPRRGPLPGLPCPVNHDAVSNHRKTLETCLVVLCWAQHKLLDGQDGAFHGTDSRSPGGKNFIKTPPNCSGIETDANLGILSAPHPYPAALFPPTARH